MPELWLTAVTALLTLLHAYFSQCSASCCLDRGTKRQIHRVEENVTAFVSCPLLPEDEQPVTISLYKGETKLHSEDMMYPSLNSSQRFQVSNLNSSVSFMIRTLQVKDTGLYCCTIYTKIKQITAQTIVLVTAPEVSDQPTGSSSGCSDQTLPLAVGCGIIIVYDLLLMAVACFLTCKLKLKKTPENPYMNTRPAGFRRHL